MAYTARRGFRRTLTDLIEPKGVGRRCEIIGDGTEARAHENDLCSPSYS